MRRYGYGVHMTTNEPLLTVREVSALLKVSRRTLERWEKAGKLTPVRIQGNVRYRTADVRDLIGAGA